MRALQEEEKEEEETTKYGEGDYWDERYGTSKLETLRQNSVLLLVGRQLVHNARSTATPLTTGFLAGEWAQDPYDWLFGARRKWKLREGGRIAHLESCVSSQSGRTWQTSPTP